jgi:TolB-like protein/Tfp pilus assembly protein PilF
VLLGAVAAGGWYGWRRNAAHPAVVASDGTPTIAVLPFKDLSPNHDQEYFSEGIAEEILGALARVRGMRVAGRSSSFWFKGKNVEPVEIARKLGATYLLEGSVRRSGTRVRISAEIVKPSSGERVWSQDYEREVSDVFAVQDEIARAVVQAVAPVLFAGSVRVPASRVTDPEAYRLFLLGRYQNSQGTEASFRQAIEMLERSAAIDPRFEPTQATLAFAYGNLSGFKEGEEQVRLRKAAREAAERAVELDPKSPWGYPPRALQRLADLDWKGATADLDRATAIDPSNQIVLNARALLLASLGRRREAVEVQRRAVDLDPLSAIHTMNLANLLLNDGRYAEAREWARRAGEISPGVSRIACWVMGWAALLSGDASGALVDFEKVSEARGAAARIAALHALGREQEARDALARLEREHPGRPLLIAGARAWLGDKDGAFDLLEAAVRSRSPGLSALTTSPLMRPLEGDPRFVALLASLGFPVEGAATPAPGEGASAPLPSIAVLPFADMSPKHDQEYFADGVAESILNALAHVEGLKVVGRTSSFFFKGKPDDLKVIGQKLGVAYVLEGSLRKDGNGIRITAQLIRVSDGTHLWSESYDRKLSGIFKVQDEIAKAVVGALKVKLLPVAVPGSGSVGTVKPEAYREYLVGKHLLTQLSYEGSDRAAQAFERALRIDPGYAPAWAGLSSAVYGRAEGDAKETVASVLEDKRRALDAANRAVELAPALAEGYIARANLVEVRGWDWTGALDDARRAIQLNPRDAFARSAYGELLVESGNAKAALAELERAVELDPLSANAWGWLGYGYMRIGRDAEARRSWDRAKEIEPTNYFARAFGSSEPGKPMSRETALKITQREIGPKPDCFTLMRRGPAFHVLGEDAKARAAIELYVDVCGHTSAAQIADRYKMLGDRDLALDWLGRAIDQMDSGLKEHGLFRDKWKVFAAGDPRYAAAIRRMNLPPD